MTETSEWVSLRQAADLLGVHPATVRNWADKGDLPSRRTPGGHRRFRKADLTQYAATQGELQPLEVQVILQNALGQTRMTVGGGTLNQEAWYASMSEATRATMRDQGRRVLEGLRAYLAAGSPDNRLAEAIRIGKDYAAILEKDGLSLPQAVRGFFYFSDFVTNAVLTWSELNVPRSASEWAHLLRQVNTYINTMLLSIIEYYQAE
ncbi:MAG: helix-turn-helix domain-containing protein [Anaerolineae bacterium]|jgi:excisionase family DNA binding protein|uniref:helix-turn-helix domain-containing protein n=1 Tax=Candidatus Flexifilum breve TaxID=3140694 RepID=UPI001ACDE618|nr:helix-turn-helix domain-containing protein [Chloroflexota bacterium]MBK9750910.1 helix-turn-helix domain-containing protein [Chloroflexota bacterium]MBN8635448.1 helix-turn-helix domain-containing protein [Anaerolineae bacterium]